MVKKFFLLLLLLLSLSSSAQIIVDTSMQNRNVLLELYTAVRCGFSFQAFDTIKMLKTKYDQKIFPIAIHAGNLANPFPNEIDYRTDYGDSLYRLAFYGCSNFPYPVGTINRHFFDDNNSLTISRAKFSRYTDSILTNYTATANIGMRLSLDTIKNLLNIKCQVYYTNNTMGTFNKLHIVLLQHHVKSLQRQYDGNGTEPIEYNQDYMFRHAICGFNGITIKNTDSAYGKMKVDTLVSYVIPEEIDALPVVIDDLEVVAFITDENNKEVINVTGARVDELTSIYEDDNSYYVKIFPNPFSNAITVHTPTKDAKIQILNQLGVILYHNGSAYENTSIDLSQFPLGVYFVKVMGGKDLKTIKILKTN